jgi:pSer/pThr/pTyr-binding forkhead associated (FHA) protein
MSVTRTVVPGDWYGVLGESVIALLPPAAKSRVAGIWETVDDGAGFDEVLDALISGGLRELPGFVLVSGEGRDVKVVIRGPGSAELDTKDGPVTVSGSEDTTWVEKNVSGVNGVRVRVADGTGEAYTVETGLVRVASVVHPASAGLAGVPDAEAVAVPVSAPIEPPEPPAPPERPKRILPPDPQLQKPEPAPAAPIEPPVPPPVPAPVAVPAPPYDPLTSPDLAVTPEHAGDTQGGSAVARLIFSSGEVVDVDQVVVVGRAPDAGRVGTEQQVRLVTVPSPHQEISSTHLEVRPGSGADQGSAVVTDLGSTNGTVVVQPGLPAEDLRPGVEVQLAPGATIDLGEGVTIQVTRV